MEEIEEAQRITQSYLAASLAERGQMLDTITADNRWHEINSAGTDGDGTATGYYRASYSTGTLQALVLDGTTREQQHWNVTEDSIDNRPFTGFNIRSAVAEQDRVDGWEKQADWVRGAWGKMPWSDSHEYLSTKNVQAHGVTKQDRYGNLVLPLRDENGKLWSVQRITPEGEKMFTKGGRIKGCFFSIGEDNPAKPLVIVEGFATGATVWEQTGLPVVCAMNSGNLAPVAEALRTKYPDRPIIVSGDNDHAKTVNVGVEKSQLAAEKVNGLVIVPQFTGNDLGTDWNDIAAGSGGAAVREQMGDQLKAQGIGTELVPFEETRTYLQVPYADRDEAKALGARWDADRKQWFAPTEAKEEALARWPQKAEPTSPAQTADQAQAPTVKVYTQPNCSQCEATKRKLTEKGVEFEVRDITDEDREKFSQMGFRSAPIVDTGEDIWAGFRPDKLMTLSGPAGAQQVVEAKAQVKAAPALSPSEEQKIREIRQFAQSQVGGRPQPSATREQPAPNRSAQPTTQPSRTVERSR